LLSSSSLVRFALLPCIQGHSQADQPSVLISLRKRTAARKSTVLLLGPSDAGKTAILSTVCFLALYCRKSSANFQPHSSHTECLKRHTRQSSPTLDMSRFHPQKTQFGWPIFPDIPVCAHSLKNFSTMPREWCSSSMRAQLRGMAQ
jgi:hypothetical protein